MSARQKKSSSSSLFTVVLIVVLIVAGVILLKGKGHKPGDTSYAPSQSGKPSQKQVSGKPSMMPTTSVVGSMSGPVGRNQLRAYAGPNAGEITLEWQRYFLDGENFNVHYGTVSKSYPYAANSIGYISTYTVKNLTPGTKYYFAVEGIRAGNVSAGSDGEVSMVAPKSATTVVVNGPAGRNSLVAMPGKKAGTVDLSWKRFFNDTQLYNVVYGVVPGQYIYGSLNAKDTTPEDTGNYTYTVSGLTSGKRYYFALVPQRNGQGIYTTSEVSSVAR